MVNKLFWSLTSFAFVMGNENPKNTNVTTNEDGSHTPAQGDPTPTGSDNAVSHSAEVGDHRPPAGPGSAVYHSADGRGNGEVVNQHLKGKPKGGGARAPKRKGFHQGDAQKPKSFHQEDDPPELQV